MSRYHAGDKFVITVAEVFEGSNTLYRIKGFNTCIFDAKGLDKLDALREEDTESFLQAKYNEGWNDGYRAGYARGKDEAYKSPAPTQDAYNAGVRDMYIAMLSSARIWSGRNKDIKEWIINTNNKTPRDIVEKYKNLNCSIEDYLKKYLIEVGCEVRINRLFLEPQYGIVTKIYKKLGKEYMVVLMQDGDFEEFEMDEIEDDIFKTEKMYKIDEILDELNNNKEKR